MLAAARERKDWQFASRIVTATQTAQVGDVLAKSSDSSALNSFLAALNLEKAGEYSLAVNSFQTALKTGSDLIPVEDIGAHLAAIKRDHAADYEAGLQLTVNPPAPRTDSFGRPTGTTRSGMPEARLPFANPQDPAQPAKEQPIPVPARSEAAKPAAPEPEPKKP